jgi:hypothetical protein
MSDADLIDRILHGLSEAKTSRANFERFWEDTARVVLPHYQYTFNSDNYRTPGQERGLEMFDVTANTALFRYAAAMESMLTPRSGRWHGIRIADPKLNAKRNVRLWCEQVTDIMFHYRYAARSGFHTQQHDAYVTQGAFGTSAMFVDQLRDPNDPNARGLSYRNINLGEVYVSENHQGLVDKVWRRWRTSLRNVYNRFPDAPFSPGFLERLKKDPEEKVYVVHHIYPRERWSGRPLSGKAMRFGSCYVLESDRLLLEESGYRTWPMPVARYTTAPGEVYGRGPAMLVLPSIKGLNSQKKTMLKQAQRAVDPVLLAHDDGILEGVNLMPGAVNYGGMSAEGRRLVDVLPTGNLNIGVETMQEERQAINDAFYVTLFQILVDNNTMTATEVLERAREKGALLSPTFGRYQSESLGPMIAREYDVLYAQGLIPPPPPELMQAGATWEVEYDAPLNRAMKSEGAAGFQRTLQLASEIANVSQDPSVFDVFNLDEALVDTARIQSTPERYIATPEQIAAKRQGRAQAHAQQQLVDAAPAVAATLKAVGAGQVNGA